MEEKELMENEEIKKDGMVATLNGSQIATMWNDKDMLTQAWKTAQFLAKSDLVPQDTYRDKPENCLIALDIANRTGYSPFTVMQQLYIVKGKPSWSGQMAISLVNSCGRFSQLKFVFVGEVGTMSHGCYATATRLATGEQLVSDIVTMQMAKDEGWLDKNGSKWKTMPIQMMMYRAGAFFARVHCPDVLLGLPLVEEVKDTKGYEEKEEKQKIKIEL